MKAVAAFFLLLGFLPISHGWTCTEGPQKFPAAQIDASQGKVLLTDGLQNVYSLHRGSWYTLGTVALKHVSVGPAGIWGVDISNKVYKYVAGDFVVSSGQNLHQVDAGGQGQVVGVSNFTIHCLRSTVAENFRQAGALRWIPLRGSLVYISCGPNGCWGVTSTQQIFYTNMAPATCGFTGWTQVAGTAKMVEVGRDGAVFAVHPEGSVYQRAGISMVTPTGTDWVQLPMCLSVKHVSYDLGKLWVVSSGGIILMCSH